MKKTAPSVHMPSLRRPPPPQRAPLPVRDPSGLARPTNLTGATGNGGIALGFAAPASATAARDTAASAGTVIPRTVGQGAPPTLAADTRSTATAAGAGETDASAFKAVRGRVRSQRAGGAVRLVVVRPDPSSTLEHLAPSTLAFGHG